MTKYKKVTPEIAAQLQTIVGAKRFFAGDAVKDDFSHDEMPIYGKYYPEVVCEAESTEEVSAILRVCYENDILSVLQNLTKEKDTTGKILKSLKIRKSCWLKLQKLSEKIILQQLVSVVRLWILVLKRM